MVVEPPFVIANSSIAICGLIFRKDVPPVKPGEFVSDVEKFPPAAMTMFPEAFRLNRSVFFAAFCKWIIFPDGVPESVARTKKSKSFPSAA